MRSKSQSRTHSIRIPEDFYTLIKESAAINKRNIVAELSLILEQYFLKNPLEEQLKEKQRNIKKLSGLLKGLPRDNYGSTIDDVLYND